MNKSMYNHIKNTKSDFKTRYDFKKTLCYAKKYLNE